MNKDTWTFGAVSKGELLIVEHAPALVSQHLYGQVGSELLQL